MERQGRQGGCICSLAIMSASRPTQRLKAKSGAMFARKWEGPMMGRVTFRGLKAQGAVRIGANASLADGNVINIGNQVYEFDNNASVVPTPTLKQVVIVAGDPYATMNNLIAAINAVGGTMLITAAKNSHVKAI